MIINVILIIALYCMPIESSMPSICIYKNITGHDCFNCGMTRAFLSVLHFNFSKAIEYNWKVIFIFPYTVIIYLHSWMKYIRRGEKIMQNDKTRSIIAYIVPICAVIFLIQKDSSKEVKLHCAQAIVICVAFLILSFIFGFISGITGIGLISSMSYLAYVALVVIGVVKANGEENQEIPVVGDIAKSIFGKVIGE